MSGRKQYLHSDTPLTKYAMKKIKSKIKELETDIGNANSMEREIMDFGDSNDNKSEISSTSACYQEGNNLDMSVSLSIGSNLSNSLTNDECSSDEEFLEILEEIDKKRDDMTETLNETRFFESMSIDIDRSPAELLLMSLKYALINKLPITAISNLLKFVNTICSKRILPESSYQLDKICNRVTTYTLHAVCPLCSTNLGKFDELNGIVKCEVCDTEVDVSKPSNTCYFAIIDISDSVRDYLKVHESYYDYIVTKRVHKIDHIEDIYDGKLYRDFVKNLSEGDRSAYMTMIFNTDGAPVLESSTVSIWPIYLMPNEIPIRDRLSSTIVCGLWFGVNKPDMMIFLEAFVENMNHYSTIGISCTVKNEERKIKIFPILACVDSVARAPMNGTSQFNGKYGCDWCLHPGQYHGRSMRYPFIVPLPLERNRNTMIEHVKEAVENIIPVFGVKNASPLLNLRCFNIIEGFCPDYMHCFLIGVAEKITEAILKYLTLNDLKYIDELLLSIKAPHQIQRLSRPLSQRAYWKALEWENWLLFYSIPVVSTVLKNKRILQNYALLVESLFILLSMDILYSDLNRANEMLFKFVSEVEDLYGINAMTFNVHQLLHICKSVYNWGPLWAHSAFPFESANHNLLTTIHCAKGVILQIIRCMNIQRSVQILEQKVYPKCSGITLQFCENLVTKETRKTLKLTSITYFGRGKSIDMNLIENVSVTNTTQQFSKAIINGCLFATSAKINKRSCNYFAQISDGRFIKIIYFLVNIESKEELTVCQVIATRPNNYASAVKEVIQLSEKITIQTNDIVRPCVYIETKENMYIASVPNVFSH